MQQFSVVHDGSCEVRFGCGFDARDVGQNGIDAGRCQTVSCTPPHATRKQGLAILSGTNHLNVTTLGFRAVAVRLALYMLLVCNRKMQVAEFVTQLALGDLAVLDRQDRVLPGTTKVLVDGKAICPENCNAQPARRALRVTWSVSSTHVTDLYLPVMLKAHALPSMPE